MEIIKKRIILAFFVLASGGVGVFTMHYFYAQAPAIRIDLAMLKEKENLVPLLVLGSGPASLSAALYGSRMGVKTMILRGNQPGGQLTQTSYIENWPAIRKTRGAQVMSEFENQVAHFGADLLSDAASEVDLTVWPYKVVTEGGHTLYALSLMIGTGAQPRRLSIPGEQEYWGKGVTTCAICDAPYHKGDDVVVVGGGDSAMEEALELSSYAKTVHVLVRTKQIRASNSMLERVKECVNVVIHTERALLKINGNGSHITGVVVQNTATKESEDWATIRGVFLAIGHIPNTSLFKGALRCNKEGYIELKHRTQNTNVPGVFAAGDVADPTYRQAGVAAGDGIKAGLDSVWWLSSIGYNSIIQAQLEATFFDPAAMEKRELQELNSSDDYHELLKSVEEEYVVLDYFTAYCPSCMNMLPMIEWAAAKFAGKIRFCKVDASLAYDLVKKFKVPDVPHIVILKKGEVVDRLKEIKSRSELYDYLKKLLQ